MAQRYDSYLRLEPNPQRRSLTDGFAARVHDPMWFLARQWQMGEHQGENASTPVVVGFEAISTALEPTESAPQFDPRITPSEAIVEGEVDEWWTMGRRVRLGMDMAARLGMRADAESAAQFLLANPPPPYEALSQRFDGLALWNARTVLDTDGSRFGDLAIPTGRQDAWQSDELVYQDAFPLSGTGEHALRVPRHHGGRVDWFCADATVAEGAAPFVPQGDDGATQGRVYPTALHYPGAPRSRWWEIEDAAVDLGGYPPDSSHFPTTLLIELIASHSDDWFLFPVDAQAGHVLTLSPGSVIVTDAFGDSYTLAPPADDWSLFRTTGLGPGSLAIWLGAVTPLQGAPLEQVLLGRDEYSNMLWAVEQRVASRDMVAPGRTAAQEAANPTLVTPVRSSDPDEQAHYVYVPGQDAMPYWHPYELVDQPREDGLPARRFVQRRFVDFARVNPELLPAATARVLRAMTPSGERVHEIEPATIPDIGIAIERRAMLARDTNGMPVLWIRRQRMPFLAPPGRHLRFDVMAQGDLPP